MVGSPPGVVGLGLTGCEKTGVTATEPGVCTASSRGAVVGWVVALGVFSTAVGGAAVALSDPLGVAVGALTWVAVGFGVLVAVAWLVGNIRYLTGSLMLSKNRSYCSGVLDEIDCKIQELE